jgi:tetratricopeptide (TPR) repeat protein
VTPTDSAPTPTPETTHGAASADPELEADFARRRLDGHLVAIVLKQATSEVINFASPVTLLPVSFVMATLTRGLDEEPLALGLRQTVRLLRPEGPSLVLGESLLSLARASRMSEGLETRLEWILEAIATFRKLKADRRMGRAYVDLATTLKDGKAYYDALHALEEAEQLSARIDDPGAVAAARYHRAHVYRMIDQPIEALRELEQALAALPDGPAADRWRNQIRSERIFNRLILNRLDEALQDLDAWIASGDQNSFPRFYRGEVFERRGEMERALADYAEGVVRVAREILRSRSDRFRSTTARRNRHMFERAVRLSLQLDHEAGGLGLLELMNTGGRALERAAAPNASPDRDALARVAGDAKALRDDALKALAQASRGPLGAYQERADLLIAERDLLSSQADPVADDADVGDALDEVSQRIFALLPADAVLLEYIIAGDEVWLVAATHEATLRRKSAFSPFELEILRRSFVYECEALLESTALSALERELLAPAAHLLDGKKRVVITLADAAYGIPFHAMRWPGGVLIDTHDVQYVVGGVTVKSGVRATPAAPDVRRYCFLGTASVPYEDVDDLPGVAAECALVEELVPAPERRIDFPATADHLFDGEPASVLHVSCHGSFEERAPLMSRLLFADRPVFAFEIALAQLGSDVAIVAGCQTATAASASGGYVQSLAAAFQRAGVRTVIASFWEIDDEASAELIRALYARLQGADALSPVAAFCAAQRALRARQEFGPSWYWAPFVAFEDLG